MSGSLNIGELTGYLGLDVDELQRNAAAAGRNVDDLAAEVLRAAQEIENQRMRVRLDADASAAERAIRDVEHELALIMNQPATARVDGDTRDAEERLARLQHDLARINGQRVRIRVEADASQVDNVNRSASALAASSLRAASSVATIGAGAGSVMALGAALISVAGIAGTLPALLGAVGAAAATIGVGFSGVGGALTEMGAADTASAGAASAAGAQREAAMERVRSAQDSLAQAQEQASRQAITGSQQIADAQDAVAEAIRRADQIAQDGARQVASAREAVADAIETAAARAEAAEATLERSQLSARDAQEGLNRAREDATERIEDMALALSGAALDSEAAELRLLRAQDRLKKAGTNKNSLNYKEAALGVKQAEQALAETRERYGDVQKEAEKTEAAGVDGADNVVAAQRRLDEANRQVAANQKAVTKAQVDGAKDVERAQMRLLEVEAQVAQAQEDAAADVGRAKEALARTEQQVGWARADAAKAVADAERQLALAIAAAGESAGGASGGVDKLAEAMAKLSPAGRELVRALWALKPAWDALQMDVQQRLLQGVGAEITTLAGTYLPLLNHLLGSTADAFNRAFMDISALLQTEDAITDVETGVNNVNAATDLWTQGLEPLVQILLDLWAVGSEFLPGMAQGFRDGAIAAAEFVQNARDSGELREWIQGAIDTIGQLWQLLVNIGGIFGAVFGAGSDSGATFLEMLINLTAGVRDFLSAAPVQGFLGTLFDAAPVLVPMAIALKAATMALAGLNAVVAFAATPAGAMVLAILRWVATTIVQGAIALGSMLATAASYVASWVMMAASSMASAAIMAAAWLVSILPIALVIAAVVGLAYLIWSNWDSITKWTSEAWSNICGFVEDAWNNITGFVTDAGTNIVNFLSDTWENAKKSASDGWNNMTSAATDGARRVVDEAAALPGKILSGLGHLGTLLWNAGVDVISGLWQGILASGPWLAGQIMNFVRRFVPGPVLDFLGIASPSKLFRDDVGRWIPEGLADGILGNARVAGDAAREMASATADAARGQASASMAAAGASAMSEIEMWQARAAAAFTPLTDMRDTAAGGAGRAFNGASTGEFADRTGGRPGATINVYNPAAERASDTLNRKARTLEKLGVL